MLYIIIPCYQSQNTLDRTLRSLMAQTYKDFKVILAVDGDTRTYEEFTEYDLNLEILYFDENLGPGMTRQRAMEQCPDAKYYMFLDSDDALNCLAVEYLYKSIEEKNCDFVMSAIERFDKNGKIIQLLPSNPDHHVLTWCHGKIYRKDFLIENDIKFKEDLRVNEDVYFNTMVYELSKCNYFSDQKTYIWFYTKNSLSSLEDEKQFLENTICSTKAMIDSMIDINNKKDQIDIDFVADKLILLYEAYEEAKFNNLNLKEIKKQYKKLSKELDCKSFIKDYPEEFLNKIKSMGKFKDKIYYYTETFTNFINNNF